MKTTRFREIISILEHLSTEQNRKMYKRHGSGDELYGVSFANLKTLKKEIGTDHELAKELWGTGNQDARIVATMIVYPQAMTSEDLRAWLKDITCYILVDEFVKHVVRKTPFSYELVEEWTLSRDEWTGRAGWKLLSYLALEENTANDGYFTAYLGIIEDRIHEARNWTKDAMNRVLIAIGGRNQILRENALVTAELIGEVLVDHGATSCKTPQTVDQIKKIWIRKEKCLERFDRMRREKRELNRHSMTQ